MDMVFCPDAVDWTAFGTWAQAIFTAAAAVGTVGALIYTIRTANAARAETFKIRQEAEEREKRAQAVTVCAWIHGNWTSKEVGGTTRIRMRNGSQEPVYEAVMYFVWFQGAAWHTGREAQERPEAPQLRAIVQVLPPGEFYVEIGGPTNTPMQARAAVEMAFTDAAGHHWMRNVSGELAPLATSAFEYYELGRPLPAFAQLHTGELPR